MTTDQYIHKRFRFAGRTRNLPWYPRTGTRSDLAKMFGELGFNLGVEVGTWRGDFAYELCTANPKLKLTCVDPWMAYNGRSQEREDIYYSMAVKKLEGLNIELVRKTSMDAVKTFPDGYFDFVFIDGNHLFEFAMMDILHWPKKVRKEGIIAVHDYHNECGADVIMAVDAYTHCNHIDPWYVTREHLRTAFWVNR